MHISLLLAAAFCLPPLFAQLDSTVPQPNFEAKSVSHQQTIRLNGPIATVFPLFTPEGERAWAEGWNPQYVYPSNGATAQGLVFRTFHSGTLLWVVTRFDPDKHEIAYVILGKDTLRQLSIKCTAIGNVTTASITHTYTSLSEEGNKMIDHHTPEKLGEAIKEWEAEINYFLKTGKQFTEP